MSIEGKHTSREIIGSLIRKNRIRKEFTQQELADILGSDRQYISKIENGKINLTLDYLDKIITGLKCNYSDFFNDY